MFMIKSDSKKNGSLQLTGSGLWCVVLTPTRQKNDQKLKQDLAYLAKGPGKSDMEKLKWASMVMCGLGDHRVVAYETFRQRLMVFKDRRDAVRQAKKSENESWKASVREVRVIEPTTPATSVA